MFYLSFVILAPVAHHIFEELRAPADPAPTPVADTLPRSTTAPTNAQHTAMWDAAQSELSAPA